MFGFENTVHYTVFVVCYKLVKLGHVQFPALLKVSHLARAVFFIYIILWLVIPEASALLTNWK